MKHKIIFLLVCIIPLLSTGCLRTYYPALNHTNSTPIFFETSDTTQESSNYYAADVTIAKGSYEGENVQLLKGSYTIVNTKKHSNFNSRLFGYAGNYKVVGLNKFDGTKSVFGLGADFSMNLNFKIHRLKFGLGITAGLASEFGEYYLFRKNADEEGLIHQTQSLVFISLSLFPVVAYQITDSSILSAQINLGLPGFLSPTLLLNSGDYIYSFSFIPYFGGDDNIQIGRLVFGIGMNLNLF